EDKDRYNRLLRWIWFEDKLVNEQLVFEGLAIAKFYENNEKYQNQIGKKTSFTKVLL
ncbi:MAG: thermonuclease family protein, partial [bacterium]